MSIALPRRTVAYTRVSSDEQATEGYSLADQERQCRAYPVAHEWPAVAEVYCDAGVSGATRERPALSRLLADARAGTIGRVICTKLDRMSRRAVDLLAIEHELDAYGVERVYIKDGIDTSTPVGRLLRTVLAAVAELERDMILERTKAGMAEKVRRGEAWRSRHPLGYRYVPKDKATGAPGHLEIDECTAPLVRRIFKSIADGISASQLAANLTREGIPTPRSARNWHAESILWMIHNPLYTGQASWGRTVRAKPGAPTQRIRSDDALYAPVPAIVTTDLASAAQAQLARNLKITPGINKVPYLLGGGLLVCGECHKTMTGIGGQGRYYACKRRDQDGVRRVHQSQAAAALEELAWPALANALRDPTSVLAQMHALTATDSQQAATLDAEIAALEKESGALEQQESRLLDLYLTGSLNAALLDGKAAELASQRQAIAGRLAALQDQRAAAASMPANLSSAEAACAAIATGLDALDFEGRRQIVRLLCRIIIVTPKEVIIEGAFPTTPVDGTDMTLSTSPSTSSSLLRQRPRPCRTTWPPPSAMPRGNPVP